MVEEVEGRRRSSAMSCKPRRDCADTLSALGTMWRREKDARLRLSEEVGSARTSRSAEREARSRTRTSLVKASSLPFCVKNRQRKDKERRM